jgi:isopenicillin N synthase-like dioxygenase
MSDLPTLNFAEYKEGAPGERIKFAKELTKSFQNHGFVKITNHGIDYLMRGSNSFSILYVNVDFSY